MKTKPNIRNRYIFLGDLFCIIIGVLGSYALRLDLGAAFQLYFLTACIMIGVSLVIKPLVYTYFGLYRRMWVYASIQELKIILIAVSAASILVSATMMGLFGLRVFTSFPRSLLVIDWTLSLLLVGGLRVAIRMVAESRLMNSGQGKQSANHNILIVGAGDAGALVVREMQKNPKLHLKPVGLLDDNPEKQKQQLYGVPVVGTLNDLPKVLDRLRVNEVVIAIPSAPGRVVRLVTDVCRLKGIPSHTMPGIYELLGGKVNISRLRDVDITDLLRRQPAKIHDELVGETLGGKKILVTGAGGSIGRELCRQIARWEPSELLLLGHGENSIFEALLELQESSPNLKMRPLIADIRDLNRIEHLFEIHKPQVVFHAAAHKHVPLMEANVEEAISNNVLGTQQVVEAAIANDVERFVMISTDKAIQPANVMGATKRIAEMLVLDAARRTGKPFTVVRFGNVLGSRGSVVPLFKRQIARGGPITITHPDMKRYFMTIPEAVYLVLQAASMGLGGEEFLLNMGEQVRILDLAEDLIRLSGLEPGKDIEIVFTGIRPGEKLSEELWDEGQVFVPTQHPDIVKVDTNENLVGEKLLNVVEELIRKGQQGDTSGIITMLDQLIPGSTVSGEQPSEFTSIDS
ncbi:MAG: nucleoside-diphosphate sugar epimerase/dehydratase [Anaerolineaceae bacterium]|jgi:FlaA1/EpsC-like NDP-sugar epimerase